MKLYLLLIPFFVASCFFPLLKFQDKPFVKVQFFYRYPYCGGVKPTEEMLEWYSREHPLSNTYLIISYDNRKITKVTTDSEGYVMLDTAFNLITIMLDSIHLCSHLPDPSCKKYYQSPISVVDHKEIRNLKITLQFRCNPCEPFNGKRP
ncbi:MAG: hypothetical protein N2Z72_08485 [Bacteroidales bacterium]|nr:hypothetical protein [Bacteroidales bacterium]